MQPQLPSVPMQISCMAPLPLTMTKNEDNDIEEADILPNDPTELINVDAGRDGEHNQEQQDENPVNTLSQNQDNIPNTTEDNIPNTTAMPFTTAINNRTSGDKPNGDVEMEYAEEDDDGNDAIDS